MNKPCVVVKHASFEGPALVGTLLAERGFRSSESRTYRAFELPAARPRGDGRSDGAPSTTLPTRNLRESETSSKKLWTPVSRCPGSATARNFSRPPSAARSGAVGAVVRNLIGSILDLAES